MKKISIVSGCYNEEGNIEEFVGRVRTVMAGLPQYDYEIIVIDNCSSDRSQELLRVMAAADKRLKVIFNTRNFGHIRSPYHALLQAEGDAVMLLVSDLQDPPELIPEFLAQWEDGSKVVVGVKEQSDESPLFFLARRLYYRIVTKLADTELIENFTGFGLYDRAVMDYLHKLGDPYPYFRGLVADSGFQPTRIVYRQPVRKRGFSKNNFYTLYDIAMLGFTSHSKVPLRLAAMLGFATSLFSLLVALVYLVYKLLFWSRFPLGTAPLVIGIFFFASVQLFFIGILGEYIGAIYTQVLKRPLVVEKERINF